MIVLDIPAVLQIENEAFSSPWTEEDIKSVLRRSGGFGKVAVDNAGKILGFIIYEVRANSARIWDIAVAKRAQRNRIGELLVREAASRKKAVVAVMSQSNTGAVSFFDKLGFSRSVDVPGFFDANDSAKCMVLAEQNITNNQLNQFIQAHPELANVRLADGPAFNESGRVDENNRPKPADDRSPTDMEKKIGELGEFAERYPNKTQRIRESPIPPFEVSDRDSINAIRNVLQKNEVGSIVILGEAGSGKTKLVDGFIYEMTKGAFPELAPNTPIFEVDAATLGADTKYVGQTEKRVKEIMTAADKMPIILFIDEVHTIAGVGTSMYDKNDFFERIKTYLADGRIRIIGTSTEYEFNEAFASRTAVYGRFERRIKTPMTDEQVLQAIDGWTARFKKPQIPPELARRLLDLSNRFDAVGAQPRKVGKLIDAMYARMLIERRNGTVPTLADVISAAKRSYQLDDVYFDKSLRQAKVNGMKAALGARFVGREAIIDRLVDYSKQSFVNLSGEETPKVRLLFAGPKGTGKTEMAIEYADYLGFGKKVIEMSGYSRQGGKSSEDLMREISLHVSSNPTAVLIFDEFEKASPEVQNRLLTAFSKGFFYVKESSAQDTGSGTSIRVSLRNTNIVLTTNAAQDYVARGGVDDAGIRRAAISEGFSEFVIDRLQEAMAFPAPDSRESFRKILSDEFDRFVKKYDSTPGNKPLSAQGKDELIDSLVAKHYKEGMGESPRAALADLARQFNSTVADAEFSADDGVAACDYLTAVFRSL